MSLRPPDPTSIDRNFRLALEALGLPSEEQAQLFQGGCVTCGLLADFSAAAVVFEATRSRSLAQGPASMLHATRTAVAALQAEDLLCFRADLLGRPNWHKVRLHARRLGTELGWSTTLPAAAHRARTAL